MLGCFKGRIPKQNKAQNQILTAGICERVSPAEHRKCEESLSIGGLADPRPEVIGTKRREDNDAQDHRSEDCRG
jgi:hypothetical protein